jgi:hypothetical protein
VRAIKAPAEWVFVTRIDSGMMSVLAELRATAYWQAIQAEIDDDAPPATPLGQAETEFWAGKGTASGARVS